MIRAGVGHSENSSSPKAAREACCMALESSGIEKADFGFVFTTIDHCSSYPAILKILKDTTGVACVAGASGYGILTHECEIEKSGGLAVLVVQSDVISPTSFLIPNLQESNLEVGKTIGRLMKGKAKGESLLTLFPDPLSLFSEDVFQGVEEEMGGVPIIGGNAGEDGKHRMTFQWNESGSSCDSISGMYLTGRFSSIITIAQSCKPLSNRIVVTKSRGNTILELNHRPALDILLELLSKLKIDKLEMAAALIFVGIPLEDGEGGDGPYLTRNIIGADPKRKSIAVSTELREGDEIFFLLRHGDLAKKDLEETLERIAPSVEEKKPRFGFYFNCCARGRSLYGSPDIDRLAIQQRLGPIPFAGFFTYGEIAPIGTRNFIHNFTGVLTLIGESTGGPE